jgi:hypothetical protein
MRTLPLLPWIGSDPSLWFQQIAILKEKALGEFSPSALFAS